MTVKELCELFEQFSDTEYIKFERIENPRHPRPDVCAFLMLHDLVGGAHDMVSAAEHDEIFLDVGLMDLASVISEDQVRDLVRCGVGIDEYNDCLSMFA